MDIITCLEDVVGITQKECECFPVPTIADPDHEGEGEAPQIPEYDPELSHSGYYIDDPEDGINLIFPASAKDCGDENVFEIVTNSRREAIKDLITDFGATLQEFTMPRHAEVISCFGEIEKNKNVPLSVAMGSKVGVQLRSRQVRGATIRIERLRIRTSGGDLANANLYIRKSTDDYTTDVITPIVFSATSGVLTDITLTSPIVLPLTDQFGRYINYAVVYDRQSLSPFNYRLTCGCTSKPKPAWYRYFETTGLNVDAFTEIPAWTKEQNRTYGLLIDARISCRSLDWLCRPHDQDWSGLPYFRVVAKVIQLMTVNKIIGYLLNSSKVNRYTMVKSEALMGKRNHNRKEISERLAWLSQSIPADIVDCYQCKTSNRITKGSILV